MENEGYWRPKPGFMEAGASRGGTPRPQPPHANMGSAAEQQQWDWETGSQSSARSAGSTKSAVHHALSLLASVVALTNPVKPSRPCLHSAFSTVTHDPSRCTTGPPPSDCDTCQISTSGTRTSSTSAKAADGQASEGNEADSKGQIGDSHPNNPTTLLSTHEVYNTGGGHTEWSVSDIRHRSNT